MLNNPDKEAEQCIQPSTDWNHAFEELASLQFPLISLKGPIEKGRKASIFGRQVSLNNPPSFSRLWLEMAH